MSQPASRGRNVYSTATLSPAELEALLGHARRLRAGEDSRALVGRAVILVFFNPSLRTRVSFELGVRRLGGEVVVLEPGKGMWALEHRDGVVMDGEAAEHVAEAAGVLGRYGQALGVRAFPAGRDWSEERDDPIIQAFIRHSPVPVINMESALWHPCQGLADLLTLRDHLGASASLPFASAKEPVRPRVLLTWAPHPKPLPLAVPHSFALAALQGGYDLTIAHPPRFSLDEDVLELLAHTARERSAALNFTNDARAAADGARAVYAKAWGSIADWGNAAAHQRNVAEAGPGWMVDAELMRRTREGIFMHCLPVRRNVVVADEVLDGPWARHLDQAANRLWVQQALLAWLLGARG